MDTQRHDRVGVTTASYREVPGSILDTQIDCLAEVLHMVAGSDFEMLEVQLLLASYSQASVSVLQ